MMSFFNPNATRIPDAQYLWKAKWNGARVVSVAPDYNPSSIHADLWMPIKQGADPFLAMAFVQKIIEENLVKPNFMKERTDLPVLVRLDTGMMLRETDLVDGGSDQNFYHWDLNTDAAVMIKEAMGDADEAKTIALNGIDPALGRQEFSRAVSESMKDVFAENLNDPDLQAALQDLSGGAALDAELGALLEQEAHRLAQAAKNWRGKHQMDGSPRMISRRGLFGGQLAAAANRKTGWYSVEGIGAGAGQVFFWGGWADEQGLFVVGDDGVIFAFDGEIWDRMNSPTPVPIHVLWGTDPSALWAVGWMGLILRFNGDRRHQEAGCTVDDAGKYPSVAANTPLFDVAGCRMAGRGLLAIAGRSCTLTGRSGTRRTQAFWHICVPSLF